jgi:hypothetical protein
LNYTKKATLFSTTKYSDAVNRTMAGQNKPLTLSRKHNGREDIMDTKKMTNAASVTSRGSLRIFTNHRERQFRRSEVPQGPQH